MKKIFSAILVIASAVIAFSSCSKTSIAEEKVVGSWRLTSKEMFNDATSSYVIDNYDYNNNVYMANFRPDGSFEVTVNGSLVSSSIYEMLGSDAIVIGGVQYSIAKLTGRELYLYCPSQNRTIEYYEK